MKAFLLFLGVFLLCSYLYGESPPNGPFETFHDNGQLKS